MKILFLFFTIFVIIQWFFKKKQHKEMFDNYYKFLKNGNVLLERNKGIITGAVIMFQLDEAANIEKCLLLNGSTFLAKWKECDELLYKNILLIEKSDIKKQKKSVQKVILKAIKSYKKTIDEKRELNSISI